MISIFEQTPFSLRNIERTITDYEGMLGTAITVESSLGLRVLLDSPLTDVLLGLFTVMLSTKLFFEEKQKGLLGLIRSTARGRLGTALAKWAVLLVGVFGAMVLLYGFYVLFLGIGFGFGEMARSMQSALPLRGSVLGLRMGSFLVAFFVAKWLVFVLVGLLVGALSLWARHFAYVVAGLGAVLWGSFSLFHGISSVSSWNTFKYLSGFAWFFPENFLGNYLNLNVFGYPVPLFGASVIALLVAFLSLSVAVLGFLGNVQVTALEFKGLRLRAPRSVLGFEAYKLLVVNRGALFLVAFLLVQVLSARTFQMDPFEAMYRHYMEVLAGELSEESSIFLEGERQRFEAIHERIALLDEALAAGELEAFEHGIQLAPLRQQLLFEPVFWQVWERYELLQGTGGHFVYGTGFEQLLDADGTRSPRFLLVLVLLNLVCFYQAFAMEHKGGIYTVLRTAPLGRERLLQAKLVLVLGLSSLIFVMAVLPDFLFVGRYFGFRGLLAPALSLPFLSGVPVGISLLGWLVLYFGLIWLVSLLLALFVLWCSQRMRVAFRALLLGLLALALVPVLVALGFEFFGWLSLLPVFWLNRLLAEGSWLGFLYVGLVVASLPVVWIRLKRAFL